MQIKAGFKKEWFQFSRTFRLWGILIATVSFSLADPLMYWAMNALLGSLTDTDMYGSIGGAPAQRTYSRAGGEKGAHRSVRTAVAGGLPAHHMDIQHRDGEG